MLLQSTTGRIKDRFYRNITHTPSSLPTCRGDRALSVQRTTVTRPVSHRPPAPNGTALGASFPKAVSNQTFAQMRPQILVSSGRFHISGAPIRQAFFFFTCLHQPSHYSLGKPEIQRRTLISPAKNWARAPGYSPKSHQKHSSHSTRRSNRQHRGTELGFNPGPMRGTHARLMPFDRTVLEKVTEKNKNKNKQVEGGV